MARPTDHTSVTTASRFAALARIAGVALLLLALAGCLQVKTGLQVNTDDTVSGQLTIFATKTELTTGGRTQEQGFADYRKQLPPLPEGAEAPYDDGTNYGVIITYDHTPLAKFNGNMKIVHTGNQYVVTIGLDPAVIAAQVPGGNPSSTKTYLNLTAFEITVTMPGNVISSQTNGTVINQSDVAWNLAAGVDKPLELKAVSVVPAGATTPASTASPTAKGGSSHTGVIVVVVVVILLLLVVGGLVAFLLTRKGGKGKGPGAPSAPAPTKPPVPTG
jgi:hypothetical protein